MGEPVLKKFLNFQARKALAAYHGVPTDDASIESEMRICEDAVNKKNKQKNNNNGVGF